MRADLPPEAFTKETLQEAFQWLQGQPAPVRATVDTPERLVSLFRKSQRLDQNSDTPVSSNKFIDDLKHLATSLDEFSSPSQKSVVTQTPAVKPKPVTPPPIPPEVETFVEPKIEPKQVISSTSTVSSVVKNTTTTSTVSATSSLSLDKLSQERVAEVQKRFNLSSENEALRLLITLGFEKFSQFN
ncbi:MAG: hypothetical protein HRT44_00980 [Bdellovibrionales bacterium]|nr:hypothetical protein [Bdellovibrionales bacterium]NQZ17824.1 hypothetical protein [Bdellovibrionales bacterium]